MKLTTRILSLLVLAGLIIFSAGCDKTEKKKKSEAELQFEKLASQWDLVSATVDGDDRTDDFVDLVMTLSGTFAENGTFNYDFSGTRPNPSPWPKSGTWKFDTDPSSSLIRDPETDSETPMTYTVDNSGLTINFNIQDGDPGFPGGSRVGSVSGDWTFVFVLH
jgi:hypothetical protein